MMFSGMATFNIDAKGRMAVPAKFRHVLMDCCGGQVVVTVDHTDACLQLYTREEWEKVKQTLSTLPSLDPQARHLKRMLLGNECSVELDGHGRILVPAKTREFAALSKSVVMVGQGNKFELWDEDIWSTLMDDGKDADFGNMLSPAMQELSL